MFLTCGTACCKYEVLYFIKVCKIDTQYMSMFYEPESATCASEQNVLEVPTNGKVSMWSWASVSTCWPLKILAAVTVGTV